MNVQGKTPKNHLIISSVIPQLIQIKKKITDLPTLSTQRTTPSFLTTFIAFSRYIIARCTFFTESATCVRTVNSKLAIGTRYRKISNLVEMNNVIFSSIKHLHD